MKVLSEDKYLLERICRWDDASAYRKLYKQYYPSLVAYSELIVEHTEAEDIVQTLMMNLWGRRKSLNIGDSISSYLFVSARNACLNAVKHASVQSRAISDLRLSLIDSAADCSAYRSNEIFEKMQQALDRLPEAQRQVFLMNRAGGKKYKEIASELGISEKTVEYRIYQAIKKLKASLADYLPLLLFLLSQRQLLDS